MSSPALPHTLAQDLDAAHDRLAEQAPAELVARFDAQAQALAEQAFAQRAPAVGTPAPPFALPDAEGRTVALEALLARGPVVLAFYRGDWCPYCNTQLRAYQGILDELRERGAELVAITPQAPDHTASLSAEAGLTFPVLTDAGAAVAEEYGLAFEVSEADREPFGQAGIDVAAANDDGGWRLPTPGTFVLDRDGTVLASFVDGDFRRRAEPADLLAALSS